MGSPAKVQLLQQIAAVPEMEHGKLSVYSFRARPKSQLKQGKVRRRSMTRASAISLQPAALHWVF